MIADPPGTPRQRGFSLVELLVALVAGLLLAEAIVQVFLGTQQTYRLRDQLARLQENGRFAIDLLAYDVRMAGSLGCSSRTGVIENTLAEPDSLYFDFSAPLAGFEAEGTSPGETYTISGSFPSPSGSTGWSPNLPKGITPALAGNVIPGTDVLVLRSRVGPTTPLQAMTPDRLNLPTGAESVQAGVCSGGADQVNGLCPGDLAMIGDCAVTRIFQTTMVTTFGEIGHAARSGFQPGNACGLWNGSGPCRAHAFPTLATPALGIAAEVSKIATLLYFVSRRGDDPVAEPSLYRRMVDENTGNIRANQKQELVEGVESLQILYGLDVGSGNARFVTAADVSDWSRVGSVRIGLLLRAPDEVASTPDTAIRMVNRTNIDPYDDRRLRRVVTTTIGLRSRFQ